MKESTKCLVVYLCSLVLLTLWMLFSPLTFAVYHYTEKSIGIITKWEEEQRVREWNEGLDKTGFPDYSHLFEPLQPPMILKQTSRTSVHMEPSEK